MTAEAVTSAERAEECLHALRAADHVTVLALPDLSGVIVEWEKSEKETLSAEFSSTAIPATGTRCCARCSLPTSKRSATTSRTSCTRCWKTVCPPRASCSTPRSPPISSTRRRAGMTSPRSLPSTFHTQLAAPAHLEPGAFDLLGDVRAAETAFHIYTSVGSRFIRSLCRASRSGSSVRFITRSSYRSAACSRRWSCGLARVDAKALADFGAAMDAELKTLEERIYEEADGSFNINSPSSSARCSTVSACRTAKRQKTGWSTNADGRKAALGAPHCRRRAAVPPVRQAEIDPLRLAAEGHRAGRRDHELPDDRDCHGRLSSTEPNLQNIPTRTPLGSELRRMFVPERGNVLVDADYSRSSCVCSPTSRATRRCGRRFERRGIFTPSPPRRCSACRRRQ